MEVTDLPTTRSCHRFCSFASLSGDSDLSTDALLHTCAMRFYHKLSLLSIHPGFALYPLPGQLVGAIHQVVGEEKNEGTPLVLPRDLLRDPLPNTG